MGQQPAIAILREAYYHGVEMNTVRREATPDALVLLLMLWTVAAGGTALLPAAVAVSAIALLVLLLLLLRLLPLHALLLLQLLLAALSYPVTTAVAAGGLGLPLDAVAVAATALLVLMLPLLRLLALHALLLLQLLLAAFGDSGTTAAAFTAFATATDHGPAEAIILSAAEPLGARVPNYYQYYARTARDERQGAPPPSPSSCIQASSPY